MTYRTGPQTAAIESDAREIVLLAGPGSGKTTTLLDRIRYRIARGTPPRKIACISFTNAAADEMAKRLFEGQDGESNDPTELGYTGTLHGFALRYLQRHGRKIGYGERVSLIGEDEGRALMESIARELKVNQSVDRLWDMKKNGRPTEPRLSRDHLCVAEYYSRLKQESTADFDVLLTEFRELLKSGAGRQLGDEFDELYVDEFQDSGRVDFEIYELLPIARKFMVGDPDQCQPAGTRVRLADGVTEKRIENLSEGERVMTYARHEKALLKNGIVIRIASRPFAGNLFTVCAGDKVTECTPNHRWLVRWAAGSERSKIALWITYLMRKGDHFRVGKTKLFRSGGFVGEDINGLNLRMRQEGADCGWILKVHEHPDEALAYEQIAAATYGLPEACFKASAFCSGFTQRAIDQIYAAVPDQLTRAIRCLKAHGREIEHPLIDRGQKRTRRTVEEVRACNLIDGVMSVPVAPDSVRFPDRVAAWTPIRVSFRPWAGEVYSLDVSEHHKYVANGIVTCNSIYAFRGADVAGILKKASSPGVVTIKLEHNFRSLPAICEAAQRLIENNPVRAAKKTISASSEEWAADAVTVFPTCESEREEIERVLRVLREEREDMDKDRMRPDWRDVAILTRTNALAHAYRDAVRSAGIPVAEQKRRDGPQGFGLLITTLNFLSDPENNLAAEQYVRARMGKDIAHDQRREAAKRGCSINALAMRYPQNIPALDAPKWLRDIGMPGESVMFVAEKLKAMHAGRDTTMGELTLRVMMREEETDEKPSGVSILTMHAAKGREWDVVILPAFEDEVTPSTRMNANIPEERRLAYVAATRARHRLYITTSAERTGKWGGPKHHSPSRFIRELMGNNS